MAPFPGITPQSRAEAVSRPAISELVRLATLGSLRSFEESCVTLVEPERAEVSGDVPSVTRRNAVKSFNGWMIDHGSGGNMPASNNNTATAARMRVRVIPVMSALNEKNEFDDKIASLEGRAAPGEGAGPLTGAEHLLSLELLMMAHRLSPEQPKPAAFRETTLARWCVRVHRVVQGRLVARVTSAALPFYYFLVVLWLLQQETAQGVYHSLTDVGVALAVVYANTFLMMQRATLLSRAREAAHLAREIEGLQSMSEAMAKDVRRTVRQVQLIYGVGASHAYAMYVLFTIPTILTGESPSPLVQRGSAPLYVLYVLYLFQDFCVSVGDSCFMLMEYVHLGSTLCSSLMYRLLAARFSQPISAAQLRQLVVLHQRLIEGTRALQDQLSGTVLLNMGCAVLGLTASTISLMGRAPEAYVYLTMPSTVFYIAIKCVAGDQLLGSSRGLADQVYRCPWLDGPRRFCSTVALMITRAQRPQVIYARYVGQLDVRTARVIFNRWYTFVQYLSA